MSLSFRDEMKKRNIGHAYTHGHSPQSKEAAERSVGLMHTIGRRMLISAMLDTKL